MRSLRIDVVILNTISETDVGIEGYIILYGLALYNISEEDHNIPEKDIFVIRRVRKYIFHNHINLT